MDVKEKIKRGKDDLADVLARAHQMYPDAGEPFQEVVEELEAEDLYGEAERAEEEAITQDCESAYELLSEKIDEEEANCLSDALEARQKAFIRRLAERMRDSCSKR